MVRPADLSGASGASRTPAPEAAFETWLGGVLQAGATEGALASGAELFQAAAEQSTYPQAKNALVQALSYLRDHRPELVEPFFRQVEPWLVSRAAELPAAARSKELAAIAAGTLEVQVEVSLPKDVLEQIAATQRAAVEKLYAEMTAADLREEQQLRSQAAQGKLGVMQSQLEARPGGKSSPVKKSAAVSRTSAAPKLGDDRWGAFLGRLISHHSTPDDDRALDLLVAKGRFDPALVTAMKLSGLLDELPSGEQWIQRVSAGISLAARCRYQGPKDTADRLALDVLSKSDPTPRMDYAPVQSLRDGELEGLLLKWIGTAAPGLKPAVLDHHPHIPDKSQLVAVGEQLDAIAAENGKFLEGYNVLAVMHQMGRTVPWLQLLSDKLGLVKEDYLGVSVPYSGSVIALERLNREGYRTLDDHDPRPELLARMQETLGGGNPAGFDQLKEEDIKRAVGEIIEKHRANGKPIMIIDDGGYVSKVVRKHYPAYEDRLKIVEWTTRGIRLFEQLENPKMTLISAAESGPKGELEPAFVADSLVEHFQVAMRQRFGSIEGKKILVVGSGNIGRAVALAASEAKAIVSVNDLSAERLAKAVRGTALKAEGDLAQAVAGKDAILAVTGANSLPPEIFSRIDPDTVIASASSVDIETRSPDQFANGHWSVDLSRVSLKLKPKGESGQAPKTRQKYRSEITERGAQALEAGLKDVATGAGLEVELERRDVLIGGYVLNLGRRTRVMAIQREELILLNVGESLAQAHVESRPGKHLMVPQREDRIRGLFQKHHPAEYDRSRAFQLDAV